MKQLILAPIVLFISATAAFSQSAASKKYYKAIRLAAAKRTIEQLEGGG